jgi:hypothetical protein
MAEVAALSVAAASMELDRISASAGTAPARSDIESVYAALLGATADPESAPISLLAKAIGLLSAADGSLVESLAPRTRVAVRLLRSGAAEAAWLVLIDSATGVVPRAFRAGTSSGADRIEWALPLLTAVEPPHVYADLPGFRDPRYGAPDGAYEIGDAIRLRGEVDEVIAGPQPKLAGWAAFDVLQTEPDELVAIIAIRDGEEIEWPGVRHRRADLVGGSRDVLRRRAWAGWSAELAPAMLPAVDGVWTLWLEVDHAGLSRRIRLGDSVAATAARALGSVICGRPRSELVDAAGGWALQLRR